MITIIDLLKLLILMDTIMDQYVHTRKENKELDKKFYHMKFMKENLGMKVTMAGVG